MLLLLCSKTVLVGENCIGPRAIWAGGALLAVQLGGAHRTEICCQHADAMHVGSATIQLEWCSLYLRSVSRAEKPLTGPAAATGPGTLCASGASLGDGGMAGGGRSVRALHATDSPAEGMQAGSSGRPAGRPAAAAARSVTRNGRTDAQDCALARAGVTDRQMHTNLRPALLRQRAELCDSKRHTGPAQGWRRRAKWSCAILLVAAPLQAANFERDAIASAMRELAPPPSLAPPSTPPLVGLSQPPSLPAPAPNTVQGRAIRNH